MTREMECVHSRSHHPGVLESIPKGYEDANLSERNALVVVFSSPSHSNRKPLSFLIRYEAPPGDGTLSESDAVQKKLQNFLEPLFSSLHFDYVIETFDKEVLEHEMTIPHDGIITHVVRLYENTPSATLCSSSSLERSALSDTAFFMQTVLFSSSGTLQSTLPCASHGPFACSCYSFQHLELLLNHIYTSIYGAHTNQPSSHTHFWNIIVIEESHASLHSPTHSFRELTPREEHLEMVQCKRKHQSDTCDTQPQQGKLLRWTEGLHVPCDLSYETVLRYWLRHVEERHRRDDEQRRRMFVNPDVPFKEEEMARAICYEIDERGCFVSLLVHCRLRYALLFLIDEEHVPLSVSGRIKVMALSASDVLHGAFSVLQSLHGASMRPPCSSEHRSSSFLKFPGMWKCAVCKRHFAKVREPPESCPSCHTLSCSSCRKTCQQCNQACCGLCLVEIRKKASTAHTCEKGLFCFQCL